MQFDIEIYYTWTQAAVYLGIRVVAPFTIITEDGNSVMYEAHILDFGGPKGMAVGNKESDPGEQRTAHGYTYPNFYPSYRRYDRRHFIETWNDWGRCGEKRKKPSWYTEKPWS